MLRSLVCCLVLSCSSNHPTSAPPPQPTVVTAPAGSGSAMPAADDTTKRTCCEQCAHASGRDPAGMDIRFKACASYPAEFNGGPGVDDACRGWFAANKMLLKDCESP